MNKLYIQDSTIGRYVTFETVPQLVSYLNAMIPRAYKMSREEYVQNLIDLGYGYDDPQGVMLTRAMADQFNIGIIKNSAYVRTDVHTVSSFQQEEYGN
jgi:hypothetical protein